MKTYETYVKLKLFDCTFWWHQQLRMTKPTLCYPFFRTDHNCDTVLRVSGWSSEIFPLYFGLLPLSLEMAQSPGLL